MTTTDLNNRMPELRVHGPLAGPPKEDMPYIGPLRVLIVEDEPSICRALTIALTRAGYDPTTAQTGDAALALLRERIFDLLLIDLRIPDMRGDVIYHLAISFQPQLRHQTLFTTGDITERAAKLIEACECPLLRKPFELSELTSMLKSLAPRRQGIASA